MYNRERNEDTQGHYPPNYPQNSHRNNFFTRRYQDTNSTYPGQTPNFGEHNLFIQGGPTHNNVPLYTPRCRRIAAVVYAARGGRGGR